MELSEFGTDCFGLFFVTGLLEHGEHIALVGFYAGLVEGVDIEYISAYAAACLKEVDELAEVLLGEGGKENLDVGYAAVDVSDAGAELSHLVDFVDALACDVVEAVEVGFVGGDAELTLCAAYRDYGLEDGALAFLNPLAH